MPKIPTNKQSDARNTQKDLHSMFAVGMTCDSGCMQHLPTPGTAAYALHSSQDMSPAKLADHNNTDVLQEPHNSRKLPEQNHPSAANKVDKPGVRRWCKRT